MFILPTMARSFPLVSGFLLFLAVFSGVLPLTDVAGVQAASLSPVRRARSKTEGPAGSTVHGSGSRRKSAGTSAEEWESRRARRAAAASLRNSKTYKGLTITLPDEVVDHDVGTSVTAGSGYDKKSAGRPRSRRTRSRAASRAAQRGPPSGGTVEDGDGTSTAGPHRQKAGERPRTSSPLLQRLGDGVSPGGSETPVKISLVQALPEASSLLAWAYLKSPSPTKPPTKPAVLTLTHDSEDAEQDLFETSWGSTESAGGKSIGSLLSTVASLNNSKPPTPTPTPTSSAAGKKWSCGVAPRPAPLSEEGLSLDEGCEEQAAINSIENEMEIIERMGSPASSTASTPASLSAPTRRWHGKLSPNHTSNQAGERGGLLRSRMGSAAVKSCAGTSIAPGSSGDRDDISDSTIGARAGAPLVQEVGNSEEGDAENSKHEHHGADGAERVFLLRMAGRIGGAQNLETVAEEMSTEALAERVASLQGGELAAKQRQTEETVVEDVVGGDEVPVGESGDELAAGTTSPASSAATPRVGRSRPCLSAWEKRQKRKNKVQGRAPTTPGEHPDHDQTDADTIQERFPAGVVPSPEDHELAPVVEEQGSCSEKSSNVTLEEEVEIQDSMGGTPLAQEPTLGGTPLAQEEPTAPEDQRWVVGTRLGAHNIAFGAHNIASLCYLPVGPQDGPAYRLLGSGVAIFPPGISRLQSSSQEGARELMSQQHGPAASFSSIASSSASYERAPGGPLTRRVTEVEQPQPQIFQMIGFPTPLVPLNCGQSETATAWSGAPRPQQQEHVRSSSEPRPRGVVRVRNRSVPPKHVAFDLPPEPEVDMDAGASSAASTGANKPKPPLPVVEAEEHDRVVVEKVEPPRDVLDAWTPKKVIASPKQTSLSGPPRTVFLSNTGHEELLEKNIFERRGDVVPQKNLLQRMSGSRAPEEVPEDVDESRALPFVDPFPCSLYSEQQDEHAASLESCSEARSWAPAWLQNSIKWTKSIFCPNRAKHE